MKDVEIYANTTLSDLLSDIHTATLLKRKQITDMITDLRKLITAPDDAVVVAPLIASYLDVLVKNDEHLIKIATIVQKIIAVDQKGKSGNSLEDLLSEDEKEKLMAEALEELDDATKELEKKVIDLGK